MPHRYSCSPWKATLVLATLAALAGLQACTTSPLAAAPSPRAGAVEQPAAHSVFLEDLTSQELQAAIASGHTNALVYSGSTEGNGPHLALGKHNFRAPYYAERIARGLGNTLVGQVVPFGINPEALARYPGTIALRPETFVALHEDIVRSLARTGFTRIVLLTEHGANVASLQATASRLDEEFRPRGVRILVSTDNYTRSTTEIDAWGTARGVLAGRHGGLWDTSELWLVAPDKVRPELIALGDTSGSPADPRQQVTGDPRQSSPELGRQFADIRVRNGVDEIRRLLDAVR